ncbi:hypothetical protein B0H16DRAFT_1894944 [Mycena metata]|uniref:Uncharacterized protein n=1 Tax=Mycena metata TaxID=1033252 RepID=A0AAD7HQL9_9AGAR|nr:hypothetical protein B0H16DRAFT_1894944 [Mycena metata]
MHPQNVPLRARLAEINAQIDHLQKERTVIQDAFAAVTYPVLTPAEITSEIFAQCLPPATFRALTGAHPRIAGHHTPFIALESLEFSGILQEDSLRLDASAVAPNLRIVKVDKYTLTPSTITLPWAQLTQFRAYGYTLQACVEVLRFAPNLVDCSFNFRPIQDFPGNLPESPPHLHLRRLTLSGDMSDKILQNLLLPKLEQVDLDRIAYDDAPGIDTKDFTSLLTSMPKLSELDMTVYLDQAVAILQNLRDTPNFLPCAQTIKLEVVHAVEGFL